MWEDVSYCWVVTCKNHIYHVPRNFIYKHKIPLAEADAVTSRPYQRTFQSPMRYVWQGIRL